MSFFIMRETVRKALLNKQLPLVVAHRGGAAHGRENSIETIKAALPYKPDVIEVDVHKSRDGVLYCHHGKIPIGVSLAKLHRFLTFRHIQLFTGKRDTLAAVLAVIPADVGVFLDIKDSGVQAKDLLPIIRGRPNVWVSAYTVRHLRALRRGLGEDFFYLLNHPFFSLDKGLRRVQGVADSVNAFVWQWNDATRKKLEEAGIACAHVQWFVPRGYTEPPKKRREGVMWYLYKDPTKTHRT